MSVGNVIYILESKCFFNRRSRFRADLIRCGGIIGIYYLVKRCMILYLNAGNGSFSSSPYLDAHGEADLSMR